MRLGASVAFAFNSLAQGPVTRKSCLRRESNPGPRDSRPDALATLPPRFAVVLLEIIFLFKLRVTVITFSALALIFVIINKSHRCYQLQEPWLKSLKQISKIYNCALTLSENAYLEHFILLNRLFSNVSPPGGCHKTLAGNR